MAQQGKPYECLICILKAFLADEPYVPIVESPEDHVRRLHSHPEWPATAEIHAYTSVFDEFESLKGRVIARVVKIVRSGEWPPRH